MQHHLSVQRSPPGTGNRLFAGTAPQVLPVDIQGCWFSLPRTGPWSAALPQPSAFINWDFDEKAGYIKADQSVLPCDLGISDTLSKDCGVLYCVLSSQG